MVWSGSIIWTVWHLLNTPFHKTSNYEKVRQGKSFVLNNNCPVVLSHHRLGLVGRYSDYLSHVQFLRSFKLRRNVSEAATDLCKIRAPDDRILGAGSRAQRSTTSSWCTCCHCASLSSAHSPCRSSTWDAVNCSCTLSPICSAYCASTLRWRVCCLCSRSLSIWSGTHCSNDWLELTVNYSESLVSSQLVCVSPQFHLRYLIHFK